MGGSCISHRNSVGGIFAGLSQGNDNEERETGSIDIPPNYYAEAIIYPVIAKGYMTFEQLANPNTKMDTFLKAKKMVDFDEWIKDKAEKSAKNEKDVVEYFD